MTTHSVVIAGGGPTGLMLAGELALAGVDVVVVERRPSQELSGARALGISSRSIEVLDQRGIADRFLAAGQVAQVTGFAVSRLDTSDFPTRHNYGLALRQKHIERILAAWVRELGVPILYGRDLTGFVQHDAGVDEPRRHIAGIMSGLDIRYGDAEGHPLLGRRMPDLDLVTADGPRRVFGLLHAARPLLLDFGTPRTIAAADWSDRVHCVNARYDGRWELPVLGDVSAPVAVLVRPDGYVAWVGDGTSRGLTDAMTTWFGEGANQ